MTTVIIPALKCFFFLNYTFLDSGSNLVKRNFATDLAKNQQYSFKLESVH